MRRKENPWPDRVYRTLKAAGVRQVGYVPDAGHKRLIELCLADKALDAVVLSTEEEGIGLAAGAWLGGVRGALLGRAEAGRPHERTVAEDPQVALRCVLEELRDLHQRRLMLRPL